LPALRAWVFGLCTEFGKTQAILTLDHRRSARYLPRHDHLCGVARKTGHTHGAGMPEDSGTWNGPLL